MTTREQRYRKAAAILLVSIMEMAARALPQWAPPLLTTLLIRLLQLIIITALLRGQFIEGEMGSLTPKALKRGILRGGIWSLGFGAVVGAAALLLSFMGIPPLPLIQMPLPGEPETLALFFFTGGIVTPMAEELFFRGLLYGLLRPMGVPSAILISTLLFAYAHAIHGMVPITQLAGGILFALAFEKEGHIAVPIIIHGAGNTALFTLSLI